MGEPHAAQMCSRSATNNSRLNAQGTTSETVCEFVKDSQSSRSMALNEPNVHPVPARIVKEECGHFARDKVCLVEERSKELLLFQR